MKVFTLSLTAEPTELTYNLLSFICVNYYLLSHQAVLTAEKLQLLTLWQFCCDYEEHLSVYETI